MRAVSLWEVTVEGKHLHPLLPGWHQPSTDANGKWTADGKFFLFQADGQIWALPDKTGLFGRVDGKPVQLTSSPIPLASPLPSKDGKKLFVVGSTRTWDTVPLRPESWRIPAFSLRDFGGKHYVFQRRQVDRLRYLSDRKSLAQPGGRQRSAAAYRFAHLSSPSTLVARRKANRILGLPGRNRR